MPNRTRRRVWPTLILFIDGNVEVSDLVHPDHRHRRGGDGALVDRGLQYTSVLDALRFMGKRRADVSVDRVAIEGQHDKAATSLGGFNLGNGVIFTGELPRSATSFDYYTLTGSLTVRSSSFKTMYDGVGTDGFISSSEVTIGGSSSAGNHFDDIAAGIDLASAEGSVFEVLTNVSTVRSTGWPWSPGSRSSCRAARPSTQST